MKAITLLFILTSLLFANEWAKGEQGHIVTELPPSVKEKMKLKYEKITPRKMDKNVRLTGKVSAKSGSKYTVDFTVFKKDKQYVSNGLKIIGSTPLLAGVTFDGTVKSVTRQKRGAMRMYQATVEFDGKNNELAVGTLINGTATFSTDKEVLAIPHSAIHTILHRRCIFVCTGKDGAYEVREVQLGIMSNGMTQIKVGLLPNEEIVTDGSFHLRAELLKPESNFGGHGHAH